ncbi:MAG: insulinase family protein [Planctomycetes bacterium]|nr:insulinase family protein [Planctomycetota bacterium]
MRSLCLLVFLAACAGAPAQESRENGFGVHLPVEEFFLDNGMKVLVVERHQVPRVYCALYWKVGSVNERPGITGLSHFFEHMMFKGTKKLGTTDWKRDAEFNEQIEAIMAEVRALKLRGLEALRRGKPMSEAAAQSSSTIAKADEPRWADLMKQFEALKEEQKKITIGEHISKLFAANGGTHTNASTYNDWTRYFVELPANKVELFFWLESETFMGPVWREFYPEREVVKEERRMRTDSTPTGLIQQQFNAMFWQAHPYGWPVIGWMSDIDHYTVAEAQRYYDTYYQPQNCTAVFVGDVDPIKIRELARRYFGRLQRRETQPDPIVTQEPAQAAEQRMEAEADARPSISIRWHAPAGVHADAPALDLLAMILDGRTGRLWRTLVDEKGIALQASAGYWALKHGGMLYVSANPRDPKQFAELEAAVEAVVRDVQEKGVTERELQKVKNQSLANLVRELDTNMGVGDQLGLSDVVGDWRDVFEYVKKVEKVTAADVTRVAHAICTPTGRNILIIRRRGQP